MSEPVKQDYYLNDQGLLVFTAEFLKNRGYCCGNGCLHCPFDYENVKDEVSKVNYLQKRTQSHR